MIKQSYKERRVQQSQECEARHPERYFFIRAKASAKWRGIPWDLAYEYVIRLLTPMRCEVSGIHLTFDGPKHDPWRPSLDRIDPDGGYTQDNVRIVCWMYNRAKHTGSDEDVTRLALALVGRA